MSFRRAVGSAFGSCGAVPRRPLSATVGVPLGAPPIAGLALAGRITIKVTPALVAELKESAQRIEQLMHTGD